MYGSRADQFPSPQVPYERVKSSGDRAIGQTTKQAKPDLTAIRLVFTIP
jgi:hypothetical protein